MNTYLLVLLGSCAATFIVFIVSIVLFCRLQKKRHYKCPHCGHRSKPGGLTAYFSKKENVTDRLLTCPRCGYKNFMENIDDEQYKRELEEKKDAKENESEE